MHYVLVSRPWTKDLTPTHQGRFPMPDSYILKNCSFLFSNQRAKKVVSDSPGLKWILGSG